MSFAAIFDMDGVLVDSSDIHFEAWSTLGQEIGTPHTREFFDSTFGMHNAQIFPLWLGEMEPRELERLSRRKEQLYRDLAADRLTPLPGALELLADLRREGIAIAVGSSGPLANVELILRILKISEQFAALSTGDEVTHGKPHPEVFLKAAHKLGRAPADCVVIEDAPQGIEAARRAGMKVLAVTSSHPAGELAADRVVESLTEVRASTLRQLVFPV